MPKLRVFVTVCKLYTNSCIQMILTRQGVHISESAESKHHLQIEMTIIWLQKSGRQPSPDGNALNVWSQKVHISCCIIMLKCPSFQGVAYYIFWEFRVRGRGCYIWVMLKHPPLPANNFTGTTDYFTFL